MDHIEYLRMIGARGGKVKSERKTASGRRNTAKATAARKAKAKAKVA